ncbi:TRAM domain-containing protein [Salinigranum halophilum]|uniref:TRAM domain-containing protein n=1 Tax=Salinigranum halophilum TaxID=2565931 RepID=UPI001F27C6C0|nr:TRAM domain-containing protein [Salinigranum halophilum]
MDTATNHSLTRSLDDRDRGEVRRDFSVQFLVGDDVPDDRSRCVDRGYVVFVSKTKPGERVTIRITETRENVAFAEVVQTLD